MMPMAAGMMPVTAQPGMGQAWMPPPPGFIPVTGALAGLDYLKFVDQLLVKQEAHLAEAYPWTLHPIVSKN
nr:hypothetical protein BaRGS_025343 [Batillaria attramentaria]